MLSAALPSTYEGGRVPFRPHPPISGVGVSGVGGEAEGQLCLVSDERTNSGRQSPVMW